MHFCMLMCMRSTSVRIDEDTHRELKVLAAELGRSVGDTVSLAVRGLRQERIGRQLAEPVAAEEQAWLDADLG
jgi:plasmid stability protein